MGVIKPPTTQSLILKKTTAPASVFPASTITLMGKMLGLELYGVRESELGKEMELWADEESSAEEGEEGGPGPP